MPAFLILLIGLFAICGGAFNWDWFMEHRKAAFITLLFGGRTGARIFYIVLGLLLVLGGFLMMSGMLQN
jgi:hypothetical protein